MFTLRIQSSGPRKIETIKLVREVLGCGLKEAKDLVDSAPFDLPLASEALAHEVAQRLRTIGVDIGHLDGEPDARTNIPEGDGPFHVVVEEVGNRKIQVIKVVREITQLDLLGAKNLVDQGEFHIERDLDGQAATSAAERLTEAGATVRVISALERASAPRKPTPPPSKMGPMPY